MVTITTIHTLTSVEDLKKVVYYVQIFICMTGPLTTQPGALVIPPEVQHFLERMLDDAGIAPQNPDLRTTMMAELAARLQQQIILDLLDKLEQGKFDEFEKLMETNPSPDRIIGFLKLAIPGNVEVVSQTMLNFKDTFVAAASN